MDLSIVILNYNSKDFLLPCIKGIIENTKGIDYEIIIVDNASTDGSVAYIEQKIISRFGEVVKLVISKENKGFAFGNNLGIKFSRGKYVLIMNPDILIWENSIKNIFDFMEERPNSGLASPRLLSPDGSLQYFCYRFPNPSVLIYRRTPFARFSFARRAINDYLMTDWDHSQNRKVEWVQGSFMIARKQAIEEVGLMDERYFMFLEDTDWCRRFWKSGWEVWYAADIEIIHYHSRASYTGRFYKELFNKMAWIHVSSAIKYFAKWGTKPPKINYGK